MRLGGHNISRIGTKINENIWCFQMVASKYKFIYYISKRLAGNLWGMKF